MIFCNIILSFWNFAYLYMFRKGQNNWINRENEHTSYELLKSVRRFSGGDMMVSLGRFVVFIHRQGWRIEDQKTERALNKFGLTSETNKHYTRVSLDQKRGNHNFLTRKTLRDICSSVQKNTLNSFDENMYYSTLESCVKTRLSTNTICSKLVLISFQKKPKDIWI